MDFDALAAILTRIHAGEIRCVARDTAEPSPLSHEILNARPYAFLDDAPLEERRTQAVQTRRAMRSVGRRRSGRARRRRHRARPRRSEARSARRRRAARRAAHRRLPDRGGRAGAAAGAVRATCDRARRATDIPEFRIPNSEFVWRRSACPSCAAVHPDARCEPAIDAAAVARGARLDARRGDRRAAARPADDRRADHRARARRLAGDRPSRRRRGAARARERRASCCAGRFRPIGSRQARVRPARLASPASPAARMVRPPPARAHPPLHAQPPARRDRAGQPGRLHAVPVRLAARRIRRAG